MRLTLCFLVGVVGGAAIAMIPVLALSYGTSLPPDAISGIAILLGMAGGYAGTIFAMDKWGEA